MFEQYRKLGITGATILCGRGEVDQLIIGILIALVAALLYFGSSPYKDFNDDLFSMFTHFQIFLVLLWSLLVKFEKLVKDDQEDFRKILDENGINEPTLSGSEGPIGILQTKTLGWLLIASNVSVLIVFCAFMIIEIKSIRATVRVRRRWDDIKGDVDKTESVEDVLDKMDMDLRPSDLTMVMNKLQKQSLSKEDGDFDDVDGVGMELKTINKRRSKNDEKRQSTSMMEMNPMMKSGGASKKSEQTPTPTPTPTPRPTPTPKKNSNRSPGGENQYDSEVAPHIARVAGFNKYGNKKSDGPKKTTNATNAKSSANDNNRLEGSTPPPPPQTAVPPPPQPNWERKLDDETGLEYFEHRLTGDSSWEKPQDYDGGD